jgi:hypothetical protein
MDQKIIELADKLNVASDLIWETAVRQSHIEFFWNGLFYILLSISLFVIWDQRKKLIQKENDDDNIFIINVIACFVGFAAILFWLLMLYNIINFLINPDYMALSIILK